MGQRRSDARAQEGGRAAPEPLRRQRKPKGSARFIPDTDDEWPPLIITETVYVPVEQRRRLLDDEDLQQLITVAINVLLDRGVPAAEKWWQERGRPALEARRAKRRERRRQRRDKTKDKNIGRNAGTAVVEADVVETDTSRSSPKAPASLEGPRPSMSSAEAKARFLAALAARAYSDEQMRLVMGANIIDGEGLAELRQSLAQLPQAQLRQLLEAMATTPSLLEESSLAELASVLGRRELA